MYFSIYPFILIFTTCRHKWRVWRSLDKTIGRIPSSLPTAAYKARMKMNSESWVKKETGRMCFNIKNVFFGSFEAVTNTKRIVVYVCSSCLHRHTNYTFRCICTLYYMLYMSNMSCIINVNKYFCMYVFVF